MGLLSDILVVLLLNSEFCSFLVGIDVCEVVMVLYMDWDILWDVMGMVYVSGRRTDGETQWRLEVWSFEDTHYIMLKFYSDNCEEVSCVDHATATLIATNCGSCMLCSPQRGANDNDIHVRLSAIRSNISSGRNTIGLRICFDTKVIYINRS